ncbi:putative ubiquinol-cytochrome C reductase hinge protein [Elsinoe australis]|uniref:Cytochrome b-c1 complex subunit 6, mitochondrial n=1 Tax=Elsinoe australis TaxID=40998 RepID=A0A2P7Z3C4_9PEZI|nr:hypothetical protein B9Z65_5637 [Elsinoe australis]TKX26879.1 putative ubiquinol-cytochrome C reductase hinge protein [Elsinoe australis]
MGWFDYVSDLMSSVTIQSAEADIQDDMHSASGDFNSSKDQKGDIGTAQHERGSAVKGGVSTNTPHAGTNEESESEKEANKDAANVKAGESDPGHKPGSEGGKEAAGQVGSGSAGPHGGPVGKGDDDEEEGGDEEEAEEEEEEEEEEPEDPMPKIQEQCEKTAACAPLKHHYDECAERVTRQHEENGKADEDCVEEFFHLMHCTSQCAAPKLFKQLR